MALFKTTYKETLRQLKKEQLNLNVCNNTDLEPYDSYTIDLSNDMDPVNSEFLYKKINEKTSHSYQLPMPDSAKYAIRNTFTFDEIISIMPSLFLEDDKPTVDMDFLTGYYLSHYYLPQHSKVIKSFHAGLTKDSLVRGIYYRINKIKGSQWKLHGCDATLDKKYKNIYINGIRKPCDIYNSNTANSIRIQMSELISTKSLTLYTADIKSNSAIDVLKQYLLIIDYIADNGLLILRLPTNWHIYYTSIVSILTLFISMYKVVKIFKTPWGVIPKYYLLLRDIKKSISARTLTNLNTYVKDANDITPLIKEEFYQLEDNMLINNIDSCYCSLMSFDEFNSSQLNTNIWVDLISKI